MIKMLLLLKKSLLQKPQNVVLTTSKCCSTGLNLWNSELTSEIKHNIENYWKNKINSEKYNENDRTKQKYYVLSMFPYPSGNLHMGHVRVYTISDSIARYQRMQGKNVIHPIGWDAFGLPAENAAINRKIPPDVWTRQNISHMKNQLEQLGCNFDWDRELSTCDEEYYKWTQELFLKLFDKGLVYQREALVNWDPIDKTVLADEQVDEDGFSWRSGAKVEKKLLKQWFVRTTAFACDLLKGLDDSILQDWKDVIKLQRNWIGECDGVKIDFKISNSNDEFVTLWTDKPEYVEYAKFVVVSYEHVLAKRENLKSNEGCRKLERTVLNPFTKEELPVFASNNDEDDGVLGQSDSHIGIPDVLEESTNFAIKHKIPYDQVPKLSTIEAVETKQNEICKKCQQLNIGGYRTSSKLRDWLISRQRYWGTPIPIIHCDKCGVQPVLRSDLPVKLPKLDPKVSDKLSQNSRWVTAVCPKCKSHARRETDTMDTFVDSSWYYLRYLDPKNNEKMFDESKIKHLMPVDLYIGGKEHATLHLYYARFICHFLHSLGLVPEREPFKRLLVQGMVMGRSYRIKGSGEYLPESKVKVLDLKRNKAVSVDSGQPVVVAWEKMSKSKFNGVDPEDMFKEYGIDTTRLLILADVSPTSHRNWNSNTFPGVLNWQRRLWLTIQDFLNHRNSQPPMIDQDQFRNHDDYMFDSRNFYVKGASMNYVITQQLSVAVSKLQGLTNSLRKMPPAVFAYSTNFQRALACQIIMLAPMAPHFASELWSGFVSASNRLEDDGEIFWDKTVFEQNWPQTDMNYCLNLICQINGCHTAEVKVPREDLDKLSKEEALNLVLKENIVRNRLVKREMKGVHFKLYEGYEGVLNIVTEKVTENEKQEFVQH